MAFRLTIDWFATLIFLFSLSACVPGDIKATVSTSTLAKPTHTAPVEAAQKPTAAQALLTTSQPVEKNTEPTVTPVPVKEAPISAIFQGPLSVIIKSFLGLTYFSMFCRFLATAI